MFTDLHCHLLPGVDDGARDASEAVAMARALRAVGFGQVVVTPHAAAAGDAVCEARRVELERLLGEAGLELRLHPGAENRLDERFLEAELAGRGRHLGTSRYVLVETPYETVVPALPELIFRLRRKGVRPVFAHPERCAEFQDPGRAEQAVRSGGLFQLDLGSLLGRYGKSARRVARRLLEAELYAVAASDLHAPQDAERWLGKALDELLRLAGELAFGALLQENPARILTDEELA